MKRFHVHISVDDLAANIRFYATVFGQEPTVRKDDYAKWMIDDPRVNFAISKRGHRPGVNHLGIQVESDAELAQLRSRVASADVALLDQTNASCCYVKSDKYWVTDPQGVAWETYRTLEAIETFGEDTRARTETATGACCIPAAAQDARSTADAKACCG